ncbi:hypothetical protein [Cytophaga aurantiaca]|uniref:hypothetical protein n=1 Tax=Cytophaga aurantiaca TaxID=29530 RepID=UPI00035E4BF4|nr:hypothetical protein [Cytophaga aurantiaca]
MNKYTKSILLLSCLLLTVVHVHAQLPGDPGGGDPDVGAPLDGGILIALLGGLGIGFYKFVFKKNKQ